MTWKSPAKPMGTTISLAGLCLGGCRKDSANSLNVRLKIQTAPAGGKIPGWKTNRPGLEPPDRCLFCSTAFNKSRHFSEVSFPQCVKWARGDEDCHLHPPSLCFPPGLGGCQSWSIGFRGELERMSVAGSRAHRPPRPTGQPCGLPVDCSCPYVWLFSPCAAVSTPLCQNIPLLWQKTET